MRKIVGCALAAALCLGSFALADAAYWTRNVDFYYHANPGCGGLEGMVPISAEAAQAFSKYVCPVCVPGQDDGADVQAAARGGTIVVRFSDAWLNEPELTGVFGWSGDAQYSGAQALNMLGQYLHGDAYNAFLETFNAGGSAEGRANIPHILSADGALIMCKRHIGSEWFIVVRPNQEFKDEWDMYWRVSSYALNMQDGALTTAFDQQTIEETRSLRLESMNGSDPVYERSNETMDIAVYQALAGNIAVIREKNPGARSVENVQLRIAGAHEDIAVTGYAEGESAIYCCMLTDAELAALQRNAKMEILHVENVNSFAYRIAGEGEYTYHARENDELLFTVQAETGTDPVDGVFRLILDGEPDRFVKQTALEDRLMDYAGARIELEADAQPLDSERITPLAWSGEKGVLLVENHSRKEYAVGERILTQGIEFGVQYELAAADEAGGYSCWLMDQDGRMLSHDGPYIAIAVMENGRIVRWDAEGTAVACDFLAQDD